jgi:hypothetical protein
MEKDLHNSFFLRSFTPALYIKKRTDEKSSQNVWIYQLLFVSLF